MAIKPLVMLVDDDEDVLKLCRRILEPAGFEVRTYDNCNSATAAINHDEVAYDILISDSSLSQHFEAGYIDNKVIAASKEKHPNVPVISISGYPTKPNLSNVHLNKPFLPNELLELIRVQLKR